MPIAALEAMVAGLPIVGTRVGDMPRIVDDASGVLVPPGRPEELADALIRVLTDADLRRAMGEVGRDRARVRPRCGSLVPATARPVRRARRAAPRAHSDRRCGGSTVRVAMVILEYSPRTGGAQRQIAAVAPLLAQRGIEVHVLTRRSAGLAEREEIDGVPVHRLAAPGPKAIASLSFTANAIARLAALRPDIVHAHSLFSPATIAVLARERFGVGAVVKVLRGGLGGDVERLRAKLASGAPRPRAAALDRRVRRDQRRDRRRARLSRHRTWASPSHSQWRRHRALPTRGARRSRRAASTSIISRRSDGDLLRAARAREADRAAIRGLEAPIAAPTGEVARDRRRRPRGRIAAAHGPARCPLRGRSRGRACRTSSVPMPS